MKPVAIFAATRWEIRAVRRVLPTNRSLSVDGIHCLIGSKQGRPFWLVQTGVGPARAARSAEAIFTAQPMALAVSTGFACALAPAAIGSLLLGDSTVSIHRTLDGAMRRDAVRCDDAAKAGLTAAAQRAGSVVATGMVLSSDMVVWRADDKRAVARSTKAIGLDMESAALGNAAMRHGIPFAIVRTVSDGVDEDLPLDFNLFLRPAGWLTGGWALLTHPSSIAGMNRLRRQSRIAGGQLGTVFDAWAATGFQGCLEN